MTPLPPTDFSNQFLAMAGDPEPFVPHATPNRDGDCIEFFARPDPFYGERVDDLVTVYRSQETDEVVGALIKGVQRFCRAMFAKFPGFQIEIVDGRVKLACLFRVKLWSSAPSTERRPTITYQKLIEVAEETGVEAELCAV